MTDSNTGRFVWYELMTTDPRAAIAFYGEVVGWKTQVWESGDYTMWVGSQGPLGGVMTLPEKAKQMGAPPHWMANVEVADVDRTVARVRELGGNLYHGPEDVPEVGRVAVIANPCGASIAVFKPQRSMPPHDTGKHGEVCWNELITADQDRSMAFYGDIFGWEHMLDHDMGPMGKYVLYGRRGQQLGGIMNKTPDMPMPPTFVYYFQVDHLDAAIGRAQKMGARLVVGPIPVPGGAHVAQLVDPQGAWFALHQAAAAPAA